MLYKSKLFSSFNIFVLVLVENIAKLLFPRIVLNISLFILLPPLEFKNISDVSICNEQSLNY